MERKNTQYSSRRKSDLSRRIRSSTRNIQTTCTTYERMGTSARRHKYKSTLKIEDKDPPIYRAKGSDLTVKDIIDNIEYNLFERKNSSCKKKKELGEIEEKRIEIEEEASGETLRKHEEMKEKSTKKNF